MRRLLFLALLTFRVGAGDAPSLRIDGLFPGMSIAKARLIHPALKSTGLTMRNSYTGQLFQALKDSQVHICADDEVVHLVSGGSLECPGLDPPIELGMPFKYARKALASRYRVVEERPDAVVANADGVRIIIEHNKTSVILIALQDYAWP